MIVASALILVSVMGCCLNKNRGIFYFFATALLSSLYLFYNPESGYDLHRYYDIMEIVSRNTFSDLFGLKIIVDDWYYNYAIKDFANNSQVFMLVVFICSRVAFREILPFVFSFLTYTLLFLFIKKIGKKEGLSHSSIAILTIVILACIDFRFISMLRNISAYAIFVYFTYIDLVEKKKRPLCFVMYIIACMIHSSCVVLLGIRVLVFLSKKYMTKYIAALLVMISGFLNLIIYILRTFFPGIEYLQRIATKISDYYIRRTNYNYKGAMFFIICIVICCLIYLFVHRKKIVSNEYNLYDEFSIYVTAFTVGSIYQYDILLRNCELLVMIHIVYIALFLKEYVRIDGLKIRVINEKANWISSRMVLFLVSMLVSMSFMFYFLFSYIPMDSGFSL